MECAIASVLNQTSVSYELIIVNDGSTDETKSHLDTISSKDNITIIHNERNQGLQKSLNIGLSVAVGEFIARIDDDDQWILTDKLYSQVACFKEDEKRVLVGTSFRRGQDIIHNPKTDISIRAQILFRCPFQHSTVMFRRTINGRDVYYSEGLTYSEDWDLWLRLGRVGSLYNLDIVSTQIGEGDNLSEEYFVKQLPINRDLYFAYRNYYPRRFRALVYHTFLQCFFFLFNVNGRIHSVFKKVFKWTFRQ